MKKRILALFLAGIMTVTMAPVESFAAAPAEKPFFEETVQPETPEENEDVQPETPEENGDAQPETLGENETVQPETPGEEENTQPETPGQEENIQPETPGEILQPELPNQEESIWPELTDQEEGQPEEPEKDTEKPSKQGTDSQEKKDLEDTPELALEEELSPEEMLANWKAPAGGMVFRKGKISEETSKSLETVRLKRNSNGEFEYETGFVESQKYDSSWDIYASHYIYNNLKSGEKKFWNALDDVCREYLTGTKNAISQNAAVVNEYGNIIDYVKVFLTKGIEYSELGLDSDDAGEIYIMFKYSNPQYYFLDESLLTSDGEWFPSMYEDFANGSSRRSATARVKAQIDAAQKQIAKGKNEAEKAKIAHDWILAKTTYDPGFSMEDPSGAYTLYSQSAYSVFCDDYTVCAGYTLAFEMLMNGAGVDTIGVTSTAHAWNMVSINDSWYHVDCTWDDNIVDDYGEKTCYMYFNRSQAKMTGELDQGGMHQMESCYSGLVPKSTLDSGATLTSPGKCKTPSGTTGAPKITQKAVSGNQVQFTLSSSTSGAEIYYTVDGKKPSSSFTKGYRYRGTFKVKKGTTVKAIAVRDTKKDSSISSLKAGSTSKTYTVKFNTMGGNKIASKKVNANSKVKQPSNPKRAKYAFAGWYTDKKYKTKWDFKKKVTKNITLYAKWKKVTVQKPSVSSLTNLSGKKLKVKIKKVSGAKGYQIRYSTNSKLKSAQKITTKSTTKTISKLKKKTYYVQVRAYKTDSTGKKIYSSWSKTKKIKIRK
ncbi:MAG: hypothetical protein HFH41_05655 [Lachnospiraceae bacterium]|nr:hypothetical protein [Lachnospiraceae bacterium]